MFPPAQTSQGGVLDLVFGCISKIIKCFHQPKHHKGGLIGGTNYTMRDGGSALTCYSQLAMLPLHFYWHTNTYASCFISTGVMQQIMQEALPSSQFYTKPLCILHHCILLLLLKDRYKYMQLHL